MKNQFTIASAYQWDSKISKRAIKQICDRTKKSFDGSKGKSLKYNINYRRLRSSAGRTMLDSIINRIKKSQIVIFDISENNPNVYLELGIALSLINRTEFLSVYLIRLKTAEKLPYGIPTDLHGYFISEYIVEKNDKITFKDNNSLRMSIESDVKEYFNVSFKFNQIDEIENNETHE